MFFNIKDNSCCTKTLRLKKPKEIIRKPYRAIPFTLMKFFECTFSVFNVSAMPHHA